MADVLMQPLRWWNNHAVAQQSSLRGMRVLKIFEFVETSPDSPDSHHHGVREDDASSIYVGVITSVLNPNEARVLWSDGDEEVLSLLDIDAENCLARERLSKNASSPAFATPPSVRRKVVLEKGESGAWVDAQPAPHTRRSQRNRVQSTAVAMTPEVVCGDCSHSFSSPASLRSHRRHCKHSVLRSFSESPTACKCGATTHKRPNHRCCPLNRKNIWAAQQHAAREAVNDDEEEFNDSSDDESAAEGRGPPTHEVAACDSSFVGEWTGKWEKCWIARGEGEGGSALAADLTDSSSGDDNAFARLLSLTVLDEESGELVDVANVSPKVSVLFTVTFCANPSHNMTRSP